MQLSHEIDKVFAKLHAGRIDPEVACCAVEQLISAHVRRPLAHLDVSIRSALERMRQRAADYAAIEAEVLAWISLRVDTDAHAVLWL